MTEPVGRWNLRIQVQGTREPGRLIKPRRMGWVQRIIRFGAFCLMWVGALWWLYLG